MRSGSLKSEQEFDIYFRGKLLLSQHFVLCPREQIVSKSFLGTGPGAGKIGINLLKTRLVCTCLVAVDFSCRQESSSEYRDWTWNENWSLIQIIRRTVGNYLSMCLLSLEKKYFGYVFYFNRK